MYFDFDLFKIFYIIPLTILFIANALLIAALIGIFSTIVFLILNRKITSDLFSKIVWRAVRLFSVINIFIILISLYCSNDIFRFGSIRSKGIFIDFLLFTGLIGIPFAIGLKILVFPLMKTLNIKRRSINVICVLCIFLPTVILNNLIWGFIPPTIFFNEKELKREMNASDYVKNNLVQNSLCLFKRL